jgi:predicted flap endonuclease-1-like 5' DNA nuclease
MPEIILSTNLVYRGNSYDAGDTVEVNAETLAQFPFLTVTAPVAEQKSPSEETTEPEDKTRREAFDLTSIDGIGPATAKKLADAGLDSEDELRTAPLETIEEVAGAKAAAAIEEWRAD